MEFQIKFFLRNYSSHSRPNPAAGAGRARKSRLVSPAQQLATVCNTGKGARDWVRNLAGEFTPAAL